MKKALIHYFSGTGNSLMAAKYLGNQEELSEYEFTFHAIENGQCGHLKDYSLHLFFFPVYATSVPHIVTKYIHSLEDGGMAKTVVISTNGKISTRIRDGYQGWALHQARICLKLRHYDVIMSDTLDLPFNVCNVAPPRNKDANQIIMEEGLKPLNRIANRIAKEQTYHRSILPINFLWSIPFGIAYYFIGRRGFGKLFAADNSCNHCNRCVKECPVHTIQSDGKRIRWGFRCEGCLRCINNCPQKSIQTSSIRLLVILVPMIMNPFNLLYPVLKDRFFNHTTPIITDIIRVLYSVTSLVLLWLILDQCINILSRFAFFRKLFGFGHTQFFGRYHANKIKAAKKV